MALTPVVAPRPLLTFPTTGKTQEWHLVEDLRAEMAAAFPSLDVMAEAQKARAWVIANPRNRKTASGMGRFLFSWLGRAQNQARPGLAMASPGYTPREQRGMVAADMWLGESK